MKVKNIQTQPLDREEQEDDASATQAVRQANMVAICAVIATTIIAITWIVRLFTL